MSNTQVIADLARKNWELECKLERIREFNDIIYEQSHRRKPEVNCIMSASIDICNELDIRGNWK